MTYYINSTPNNSGNYGNPKSKPFVGCVALPDELLSAYIEARGFVIPSIENGSVVSLEVNQEALDAYLAEHPDVEPEQEATVEERVTALENAIERGLNL